MKKKTLCFACLIVALTLGSGLELRAAKNKADKPSKEEKQAAKLAKQEEKLVKLLGGPESWKPTVLKDLRRGMSCQEASRYFSGINCSDIIPRDSAGLGSAIAEYKFHFVSDGLYAVTIVFGARILDEKRFTEALYNVAQRKWGLIRSGSLAGAKWTTPDYDEIEFSYKDSCWELKACLPSYDPGSVDLDKLNPESVAAELATLLGPDKQYLPTLLSSLSGGMNSEQVAGFFPSLTNSTPGSSHHFEKVSIAGHPLVAGLHFSFQSDRLSYVNLVFHYQLDREQFKQTVFPLLQKRWGKSARLSKDGESINNFGQPGFLEMRYEGNRWEYRIDMEGIKGNTAAAPSSSAAQPSLQGLWTLSAARQGQQTEAMTGGTKRQLRFKGNQIFMLENGKVVMENYFTVSGSALSFTSGPGGKAVQEFAKIVSHKNKELILLLAGESIQMIFSKTT